ncbi:MAG: ATP-binding cassette domain-containing protein [Leptolyngbyaceae bacterium]|nr:ATP-binding cassette domain-containing protein [Leptolyngbyaceae bacterium]
MSSSTAYLRFEHVSLSATSSSQSLLKDLSFEVKRGDRIAIVGASGAGKTSLLRLCNRLSELSAGAIYLDGQEIRQIPVLQLRQGVTLVPQESKLLGMTVQEALAYPLKLRQISDAVIQQRVSAWVEQLHIPGEWLHRTELQLSVGQRQLVAIARALIIQPQLLLLDEPTSALDTGRSVHVLQVLMNLAQEQQTTILMANHQLDLGQQFCNRVLHLHQGTLVQNLPGDQMDWTQLRESLVQAEQNNTQEWA